MSFSTIMQWDNRGKKVVIDPVTKRSWTRRIIRLQDENGTIKLKLEEKDKYKEVLVDAYGAKTIWERFKQGQCIDDCVSILGNPVPKAMKSKRASSK